MEVFDMAPRERLLVGTREIRIKVISEPYVVATRFGYAPTLTVAHVDGGPERCLYISSASLTTALERLRQTNGGLFTGLKLVICKESGDPKARYLVSTVKE
jgi:hypothetical protein